MLSVEQIMKENQAEVDRLSDKALSATVIATLHVTIELMKEELDAAIRDYERSAA